MFALKALKVVEPLKFMGFGWKITIAEGRATMSGSQSDQQIDEWHKRKLLSHKLIKT